MRLTRRVGLNLRAPPPPVGTYVQAEGVAAEGGPLVIGNGHTGRLDQGQSNLHTQVEHPGLWYRFLQPLLSDPA